MASFWPLYRILLATFWYFRIVFGRVLAFFWQTLIWPKFGTYIIPKLCQNGMSVVGQIWAILMQLLPSI